MFASIARNEQMKRDEGEIRLLGKKEIERGAFDHEMITLLAPHQIPWLTSKELIQKLNRIQLKSLIVAQLPFILPETQVPLLEKEELINALDKAHYPLLTADQLLLLDKEQKLPTLTREIIRSEKFPNALVKELKAHQVPHLRENQVPWVTPDQVKFVDKKLLKFLINEEQIRKVDPRELHHLENSVQLIHLSDNQLNALDPKRVNELHPTTIARLKLKHQINKLDPTKFIHLSGAQIRLLDKSLLNRLDLPSVARKDFPEDRVEDLEGKERINALDPSKHAHLIGAQIEELDSAHLKKLRKGSVGRTDFPHLRVTELERDQVQFLHFTRIGSVLPDHVLALGDPAKYEYLVTEEQVRVLNTDKANLSQLVPGQFSLLAQGQLDLIDPSRFKDLNVPKSVLIKLQVERQINAVNPRRFDELTSGQLALLSADNIKLLLEPTVKRADFPSAKVHDLKRDQIKFLHDNLIPAVTAEFVANVNQGQLGLLTLPDSIKAVDVKLVLHLTNNPRNPQLQHLSAQQLDKWPKERVNELREISIKRLREPEQINLLNSNNLCYLLSSQIKDHLSTPILITLDERVLCREDFPMSRVADLLDDQLKLLNINLIKSDLFPSGRVKDVTLKERINALHRNKHDFLTGAQIAELDLKYLKQLKKVSVERVDFPLERVKELEPDQVRFLHSTRIGSVLPDHVLALGDPAKYEYLVTKEQIAALDKDKSSLNQLIPEQFHLLSTDQLNLIDPAHFKNPNVSNPVLVKLQDVGQINAIDPRRFDELTSGQLALLNDDNIKLLLAPTVKRADFPAEKASKLTSEQLKWWPRNRANDLPDIAIMNVREEELLDLLNLDNLCHLLNAQIEHFLSTSVLQTLDARVLKRDAFPFCRVKDLLPGQLRHLHPHVLANFRASQRKAMPPNNIASAQTARPASRGRAETPSSSAAPAFAAAHAQTSSTQPTARSEGTTTPAASQPQPSIPSPQPVRPASTGGAQTPSSPSAPAFAAAHAQMSAIPPTARSEVTTAPAASQPQPSIPSPQPVRPASTGGAQTPSSPSAPAFAAAHAQTSSTQPTARSEGTTAPAASQPQPSTPSPQTVRPAITGRAETLSSPSAPAFAAARAQTSSTQPTARFEVTTAPAVSHLQTSAPSPLVLPSLVRDHGQKFVATYSSTNNSRGIQTSEFYQPQSSSQSTQIVGAAIAGGGGVLSSASRLLPSSPSSSLGAQFSVTNDPSLSLPSSTRIYSHSSSQQPPATPTPRQDSPTYKEPYTISSRKTSSPSSPLADRDISTLPSTKASRLWEVMKANPGKSMLGIALLVSALVLIILTTSPNITKGIWEYKIRPFLRAHDKIAISVGSVLAIGILAFLLRGSSQNVRYIHHGFST